MNEQDLLDKCWVLPLIQNFLLGIKSVYPVLHIHSVYHGSLKLNMFVKELSFFFPNLDFLSQKCIIIHLLDAKIKVYFQS